MNLLEAMRDPNLFAPWFKKSETWAAWRAFLCALFALPMTDEQLEFYRRCTGRNEPPTDPIMEGWLVCGRRAGKSFILALIAVYLACFYDYRQYLAPGERGTIVIVAVDRKQARTILRYIRGLLLGVPMLKTMIERETSDAFDLNNGVSIEVGSASYRSVRGYTVVAALCDEISFWPTDDSTDPDYAILDALRPAMATIPTARLLCASSPYAQKGALHDAFRKHFGKDGDPILVWHAATRTMNPSVPQSVIDEAMERDPAYAQAEYMAQFRTDIEAFVHREAVEACVSPGVREIMPQPSIGYFAFCDPSGGSADSMTLAVGHRNFGKQVVVVDAIREVRPPLSPEVVCGEFAKLLKTYRVGSIQSDRYGGIWPVEQFLKFGIRCEQSARPKSDLYVDLLPLVNSKRIELLDDQRLVTQLCGLERRTARGGRDSVDHAPGAHDDRVNAVAGLASMIMDKYGSYTLEGFRTDDNPDAEEDKKARDFRYQQEFAGMLLRTTGHWPW
jgi:hypothetical protein